MSTKGTEVMTLIGEAYWLDLFVQIDQAFFKLRPVVQDEIWRRVIIMINSGVHDPAQLAGAINQMISRVEVV